MCRRDRTSNEFQVPNGWRQNFQNGVIFHSGAGSYTVRGSLGNYYLNNLGGEKSQLGLYHFFKDVIDLCKK